MGKYSKLLARVKKLEQSRVKDNPGFTVGLHGGFYNTVAAWPEELNGWFNADGERVTQEEIDEFYSRESNLEISREGDVPKVTVIVEDENYT